MTHSDKSRFIGRCLCGAVRFSGRAAQADLKACHCKQCRRWSGHVWAGFTSTELTIEPTDSLRWFPSSETAERGFCAACGSSLFWRRTGHTEIDVAPGAVEEPTGLRLVGHIYTAFKGDYYEISGGLPQERCE